MNAINSKYFDTVQSDSPNVRVVRVVVVACCKFPSICEDQGPRLPQLCFIRLRLVAAAAAAV